MALSSGNFDDALIKSIKSNHSCTCKATVLVVDDNEFNLIPLTTLLESNHGLTCIKSSDGAEAVEIFRKDRVKRCCETRIQIVFMDIIMPVMDGL